MHLLLLDDAQDRLTRLENDLDTMQPEWRVSIAENARDAELIIASSPCDAIVAADSRRPQRVVDLLTSARRHRPGALRIAVAANDGDMAGLVRSEVAHRVLSTPLETQQLIGGLRSVRSLERMLGSDSLRQRIAQLNRLPPAPSTALALIRENASGTASMASVAKHVHADAALAAKVLQLSNSAFYSRGTPILEIERAVTRLGMDAVVNLVLAVQSFINPQLQTRAILASQMAVQVLRDVDKTQLGAVAATASTLAYIGKLLNLRPEESLVHRHDDDDLPNLPIESIAGAYLLSLWGLPWPIIEAVAYHSDPIAASEENFGVTTAVHTACALADGKPLDEGWLESLDAMEYVPEWEQAAMNLGCPARPN